MIGRSELFSDESCIDEYWEYVKKIGSFFGKIGWRDRFGVSRVAQHTGVLFLLAVHVTFEKAGIPFVNLSLRSVPLR